MEKLKKLYNIRDELFSEKTYEIFEKIDNTLACLSLYLSDIDDGVAQGVIAWEDTSMIDELVVVVGTIQYEIGDVITIENEEVEITQENFATFERIIHMSVPYKLVIEDDRDSIMEFLYNEGMAGDIEPLSLNLDPKADFDMTELSDEQLQAYMNTPQNNRNN